MESITEEIIVTDDGKLNYFKIYVLVDMSPSVTEFHKQQISYGVDENQNKMIRFGGVHDDGTVEKTFQNKAFCEVKTGEHGILNN
ncbi:hypothetical protein [Vagococcus teuberi]